MIEPWRKGIVVKIEPVSAFTRRFFIQIPELEIFDFKPGQFITLDLPIHEKKNKRWRSYSIASPPADNNEIELVIVLLEGGAGTHYLFNEVKEGSELCLRGPQGVFTLPPVLEHDLFLICTGTGVAPFRSMLHYIFSHHVPHKKLYLIFGCRLKTDALYCSEFEELAAKMSDFYYLPTFSREREVGLRIGYVHEVYEEIVRKEQPEANFYLCGWKVMIDEARERIKALGYDKKNIHLELYG